MLQHKIEGDDKPSLYGLARDAIRECDGDTAKATAKLVRKLRNNKRLLADITEEAVSEAAKYFVGMKMRGDRAMIVHAANPTADPRSNVIALARGITNSLMNFPLAGGKRLKDATAEQVSMQADLYEKLHNDTGHKARWLRHIAQSIPPGKLVGEVIDEARVQELWEKTGAENGQN